MRGRDLGVFSAVSDGDAGSWSLQSLSLSGTWSDECGDCAKTGVEQPEAAQLV